jgi:TPR repeat protein
MPAFHRRAFVVAHAQEVAMLIRTPLVVALAASCSGPLGAQTCSGGRDGGMDAQGCDCNDAAVVAAYAVAEPARAAVDAGPANEAWTRAIDLYDRHHYAEAMVHLRTAAAQGHPLAAEMLALMNRFGERLYGTQVHADAAEAARFAALAASLRRQQQLPVALAQPARAAPSTR